MAKGGGGGGGGSSLGAVMERSRINIVMPTPPQQAPKLDDGGSGGDIGKNIHNGGGGGGDDGGDDDDYFGGEDDGDGDGSGGGGGKGDGFLRVALPELYDRLSIGAVLAEWFRTVAELPLFIRRAVEMGLFSSAQLVRFLSMDVRPGVARAASRALPPEWARGFVGRLMADPAFAQKLVCEQLLAFGASMLYEARARGERLSSELDLALINSLGLAAAAGAAVWVTAPSRAYGAVHKFPWQQMLAQLPSCVFDASGPLRQYTSAARLGGFFASMAQLSAVGALTGAATAALSSAAVSLRRRADPDFTPSLPVPEVARSSGGLAAYFALNANLRYQLLGGMDRYLFNHTSFLWTYLGCSAVARAALAAAGEASRPWWQGLPEARAAAAPLARSTGRVRKVVRRKRATKPAAQEAGAGGSAEAAGAGLVAAAASGSSVEAGPAEAAAAAVLRDNYGPVSADDSLQVVDASVAAAEDQGAAVQVAADGEATAALQVDVEQQLLSQPAVMGSVEQLQQLLQQQEQQQQQHAASQQLQAALSQQLTLSGSNAATGAAV